MYCINEMNVEPIIIALYEELDKKERENVAFGALLRHQVSCSISMIKNSFLKVVRDQSSLTKFNGTIYTQHIAAHF